MKQKLHLTNQKIFLTKDTNNEFIVEISTGKWILNLAGACFTAIFTGGLTILTILAGAVCNSIVESKFINYIEKTLKYEKKQNGLSSQKQFSNSISNITVQDEKTEQKTQLQRINYPKSKTAEKIKEELLKLEIAYQEKVLTKEEFESKKNKLELRMERHEIDFAIEQKITKLEQAFIQEILTEEEYEAKIVSYKPENIS